MNTVAYILLILGGLWLLGVGVFIFVWPEFALKCLGKMASTNVINYSEITLRLMVGLAALQYADLSRQPSIFNVGGWFIVITSAILYLIPRRWHARYAVFWSKALSPAVLRCAAPFSLLAGGFLILALH